MIAALVSSHDDSIPNIIVLINFLVVDNNDLMLQSYAKELNNIDKKVKDPNQ